MQRTEMIELLAKSYEYFPASFRWRGTRFDVKAIEECWSARRPTTRRLFRVRCVGGTFVLEHEVASGVWRIRQWPWTYWLWRLQRQPAAARSAGPRYPLPRDRRRARLVSASPGNNMPSRPRENPPVTAEPTLMDLTLVPRRSKWTPVHQV